MSIQVLSLVKKNYVGPGRGSKKLLLLGMADVANDDGGSIYPSLQTLAVWTCCSRDHVKKLLKQLIDEGIVEVEKPSVGTGRHTDTTHYRIVLERLADSAGQTSEGGSTVTPSDARKPDAPGVCGTRVPESPGNPSNPDGGSVEPPGGVRESPRRGVCGTPDGGSVEPPIRPRSVREPREGDTRSLDSGLALPEPAEALLPKSLDHPRFRQAWLALLAHRRDKGMDALTHRSIEMGLRRAAEVGAAQAVADIELCIERGWRNVVWAKAEKQASLRVEQPEPAMTDDQRRAELTARLTDAVRRGGMRVLFENQPGADTAKWARLARGMGIDIVGLCSIATGESVDSVRAQLHTLAEQRQKVTA